jgi:pimeloyl-ACP methyl ester carboxylesterase
MHSSTVTLIFAIALVLFSAVVDSADLEREKRMALEIADSIFDGEVEMLKDGDHDFLSIYTEAEEATRGVLIIHGRGFHPDWVDTVQPLRVGLVDYGWNTLSIQMPVLGKTAKYYDYLPIFDEAIPRIEAGLAFLKSHGNTALTIVAHSCGVHMSMHYLKKFSDTGLSAYVGIGMGATDYRQPMPEPFPLDSLSMPVFDIYGADDYPAVDRLAPGRWQQIQKAGNPLSRQIVVADADHYFTDRGDALVEAIGGWLDGLDIKMTDESN